MKKTTPLKNGRRPIGTLRLAVGVASIAAGLALVLAPAGASDVNANAATTITVTHTPSGVTGECVAAELAVMNGTLVAYPYSDESKFQLTVHVSQPLCTPIAAKAVAYKMPAAGEWPQQLDQVQDFTLQDPGDTVISFAKMCDRVQFDVLTGDTPAIINTGLEHGPLLFPGNLETAFQHVGNGPNCSQATTAAPTTAVVVPSTAVVQASTTVAAPATTLPLAVLAATTVPARSSANAGLAVTGATSGPFALMGGGLLLIGAALLLASRRQVA